MTDIDFDELDRAVNSTYAGDTPVENLSNNVAVGRPDNTASRPQPVLNKIEEGNRAPSPAVRRNSGRFMDVVHPSSDMRTTPPVQTPSIGVDVSGNKEPDSAEQIVSAPDLTDSSSSPKPLESPFITDAKVEKRPLGAFSDESKKQAEALLESGLETTEQVKSAEISDRSDHPIGTDTPMPAELRDDLLSIEGDESKIVPEVAPMKQQYVEKASGADKPVAPAFDVSAYHQPLAHPVKSKSGWLMVLWIFMLIIFGAGAGAAVYFYVLPII